MTCKVFALVVAWVSPPRAAPPAVCSCSPHRGRARPRPLCGRTRRGGAGSGRSRSRVTRSGIGVRCWSPTDTRGSMQGRPTYRRESSPPRRSPSRWKPCAPSGANGAARRRIDCGSQCVIEWGCVVLRARGHPRRSRARLAAGLDCPRRGCPGLDVSRWSVHRRACQLPARCHSACVRRTITSSHALARHPGEARFRLARAEGDGIAVRPRSRVRLPREGERASAGRRRGDHQGRRCWDVSFELGRPAPPRADRRRRDRLRGPDERPGRR